MTIILDIKDGENIEATFSLINRVTLKKNPYQDLQ